MLPCFSGLIVAALTVTVSYSQTWQWATQGTGSEYDATKKICVDPGGNVYQAGWFKSPSLTFGPNTLNNSSAGYDFFLVKYSPSGQAVWARQGICTGDEDVTGIWVQGAYLYVCGTFMAGSLTIGSTTLTNTTGWQEIFILKFDTSGNLIWARKVSGNKPDHVKAIAADPSGNVYIAGTFYSDTLVFSGVPPLILSFPGYADMFYAKYDGSGNTLWARQVTDGVTPKDLTVSAAGNVFMTGYFSDNLVNIGGLSLNNPSFCQALFTVKLDGAGNGIWGKSVESPSLSMDVKSIAVDAGENVYVAGDFYNNSFTFASQTINQVGSDIFLLKYGAGGTEQWAAAAGSVSSLYGNAVDVDAAGNVFFCGSFLAPVTFGSTVLTTAGQFDLFVVKYNSSGTLLWAMRDGGSGYEGSIDLGMSGTLPVIGGTFQGPTLTLGSTTLTNAASGKDEPYVAKLGPTAAVEEPMNEMNVSLFPNPGPGIFTIEAEQGIASIEVTNSLGKIIYSSPVSSLRFRADFRYVAEGIYFVHIFSENGCVTKKITVVR